MSLKDLVKNKDFIKHTEHMSQKNHIPNCRYVIT